MHQLLDILDDHLRTVLVPSTLLSEAELPPTAKVLWMGLKASTPEIRQSTLPSLAEAVSLSRATVWRGIERLCQRGWAAVRNGGVVDLLVRDWGGSGHSDVLIPVPVSLIQDNRLDPYSKVVYASLLILLGPLDKPGELQYKDLAHPAAVSADTARTRIVQLVKHGWLSVEQNSDANKPAYTLRNPVRETHMAQLEAVAQRLRIAKFEGEQIMREWLSLLIDSRAFDDDATPGFLGNPFTHGTLQYDRYYFAGVAFEFNGPQHYGPTDEFPSERQAQLQWGRDMLKLGISVARDIRLIVVHAEDLSLERMSELVQQVSDRLALRDLKDHQPLVTYLELVSQNYRRRAGKP